MGRVSDWVTFARQVTIHRQNWPSYFNHLDPAVPAFAMLNWYCAHEDWAVAGSLRLAGSEGATLYSADRNSRLLIASEDKRRHHSVGQWLRAVLTAAAVWWSHTTALDTAKFDTVFLDGRPINMSHHTIFRCFASKLEPRSMSYSGWHPLVIGHVRKVGKKLVMAGFMQARRYRWGLLPQINAWVQTHFNLDTHLIIKSGRNLFRWYLSDEVNSVILIIHRIKLLIRPLQLVKYEKTLSTNYICKVTLLRDDDVFGLLPTHVSSIILITLL